MREPRTIVWFSTGAASAIAAKLVLRKIPDAILARCETNNEDEDNYRFEADVSKWLGKPITILQSEKYQSVRALLRHHFPDRFAATAAQSRALGVRLCRVKDERRFIDEIPADQPMTNPIVPACDFLCALAEMEPSP